MIIDRDVEATIPPGTDAELLCPVYVRDGNRNRVAAAAADISAISWENKNAATGAVIASGTFVVADVMLAAMSKATIWEMGGDGFNFHGVIPAASLLAKATNRIVVTWTAAGSGRKGSKGFRIVVT